MQPPPTASSRPSSLPSSPHRPALRPGNLQMLLRPPDPDDDDSAATPRSHSSSRARGHTRDRVLLQVTNITPALSDADPFSGHQGFYLRLSDSSRSCYVSLHADHDDLILANGLHIGQIIEVERLVPAVPVPVLRQFRVLPGRYPCVQQQDSGDDEVKEVVSERSRRPSPTHPLPERKTRRAGSPAAIGHHYRSRSTTNLSEAGSPAVAAKRRENERRLLESSRSLRKISVTPVDATSSDDDESDVSSLHSSSLSTTRRNWDFTGSIKDVRPVAPRRRSNSISPSKSCPNPIAHQNEAANDPLESARRKAEKAFKVLSKRNAHASSKTPREGLCAAVTPQSASSSGIKWCEDNVIWNSLSSSLVKHGKVAMKQRDMALQAVLDGLLEASASEKLIKCLSKYSELQSDKDDDPKELVDRFLRVSQDLDQAIFIAQSQTGLRQGKACCYNSASSASVKAATKAALDRKQSVISWIRSAIETDLSSLPAHTRVTSESAKASVAEAKPASPLFRSQSKCNCNSTSSKKTADASTDGSNLNATMDLAIAMRSDCNRWFLKYIDKFLDDIESEAGYTLCDSQVAGFLQQLKKVDDWLNRVVRHERMFTIDRGNKDSVHSEEEESDACERVRRKIYTALLRHVQFAAIVPESINGTTDEEKEQE